MKRAAYLIRIYLTFLVFFLFLKIIFMLYNGSGTGITASDYPSVLWHGLPLDLSTSGYLTAIPLLLILTNVWLRMRWLRKVLSVYYAVAAFLLSVACAVDCALYSFWGFKLDATVFNYSPKDAAASVSVIYIIIGIAAILILSFLLFKALTGARVPEDSGSAARPSEQNGRKPETGATLRHRITQSTLLVLLGGLMFLGIRGGVGRSTMNIGAVYYSENQFLNHAAVNPAFSIIYSSLKTQHFDKLYRYYPADRCRALMDSLQISTQSLDDVPLLNTGRPNVLLILMEGFSGNFIEPLGGEKGVTPEFNRLCKEGVLFEHCYANSYRTDRGTVCALSGYPSFPQISVMKLPDKSRTLPSIAASLRDVGYRTDFLYGGDINFTNMKSYFISTGYSKAVGDLHFPISTRRTHAWGVTDAIAFDTLYNQVVAHRDGKPWFTTFLTLASHEPWVVPYHRIKNNVKTNAMAYTDHCLGRFVERLKKTPVWKNLLIICVADHGINYPKGVTEATQQKNRIPILWLGGAVRAPYVFHPIINQTDLPATLLGQMGLDHSRFTFSRDVTSRTYRYPFAVHTFDNGVAFIDSTGQTVHDLTSGRNIYDGPAPSARRLRFSKAYLQATIDDLNKR